MPEIIPQPTSNIIDNINFARLGVSLLDYTRFRDKAIPDELLMDKTTGIIYYKTKNEDYISLELANRYMNDLQMISERNFQFGLYNGDTFMWDDLPITTLSANTQIKPADKDLYFPDLNEYNSFMLYFDIHGFVNNESQYFGTDPNMFITIQAFDENDQLLHTVLKSDNMATIHQTVIRKSELTRNGTLNVSYAKVTSIIVAQSVITPIDRYVLCGGFITGANTPDPVENINLADIYRNSYRAVFYALTEYWDNDLNAFKCLIQHNLNTYNLIGSVLCHDSDTITHPNLKIIDTNSLYVLLPEKSLSGHYTMNLIGLKI